MHSDALTIAIVVRMSLEKKTLPVTDSCWIVRGAQTSRSSCWHRRSASYVGTLRAPVSRRTSKIIFTCAPERRSLGKLLRRSKKNIFERVLVTAAPLQSKVIPSCSGTETIQHPEQLARHQLVVRGCPLPYVDAGPLQSVA